MSTSPLPQFLTHPVVPPGEFLNCACQSLGMCHNLSEGFRTSVNASEHDDLSKRIKDENILKHFKLVLIFTVLIFSPVNKSFNSINQLFL